MEGRRAPSKVSSFRWQPSLGSLIGKDVIDNGLQQCSAFVPSHGRQGRTRDLSAAGWAPPLPSRLGPGGAFLHLRLQIPFYNRGGLLGNSAHVWGRIVEASLAKSKG
jgi:hypothetical protein